RLLTLETCCGYEYDQAQKLFFPSDFQGSSEAHRTRQKVPRSTSRSTLAPAKADFKVKPTVKKKKTLPRAPADVSEFNCVTAKNLHPGTGILTGFPFDRGPKLGALKQNFPIS
ncbi:hypothetical protein VKS41_009342, partial [Umbelopsis sp. WA50703]